MAEKPADGGKKKGGKAKFFFLLIVILALLGGGGFAAWKFFLEPKLLGTPAPAENSAVDGAAEKNESESLPPGTMVSMEPFVVNLADPMGRRYLKVTMDVEAVDEKAAQELTVALPRIKDALLLLLSSKTFADISSMDQKIELKNDIVDRLNLIVGKGKVRNVYFTEFVVQ